MGKNKINFGQYVELAYEIFVIDNEGEASVFRFTAEQPDRFVFGLDEGMIRGFAAGISGLSAGDKFDFTVTPADAFGERDEEMVMELPRDTFLVDGKFDESRVYVGAGVPMMTADGYRVEGIVTDIDGDTVVMDFNHQLAGETLRYVGEVLLVRDATPEELTPHHHCGCGCDHDHDGCDHDHHCDCDGCDGCDH